MFASSCWHVCNASRHRFQASAQLQRCCPPSDILCLSRAGYVFVIRVKVRPRESGRRRRRQRRRDDDDAGALAPRAPRALMPEAAAASGSGSRVSWPGSALFSAGLSCAVKRARKAGSTALCRVPSPCVRIGGSSFSSNYNTRWIGRKKDVNDGVH